MNILAKLKSLKSLPTAAKDPEGTTLKMSLLREKLEERGIHAQLMQKDEIKRILTLPTVKGMTDEEVEAFSQMTVQSSAYDEGFRLLREQAEAIYAYEMFGGPFVPVGVGGGKTGISLMIPEKAYRKGLRKMILIIPASLAPQLLNNNIPLWRSKVSISYPIHVLCGRPAKERKRMCKLGRSGLYIMSDSQLSTEDASENLHNIEPELIVIDEAHKLASKQSARAARLSRIIDEYKPELVPMSGTMTVKSLIDYYFLAFKSLEDYCFLPKVPSMVDSIARLIDAEVTKDDRNTQEWHPGILKPWIEWYEREFGEQAPLGVAGFRKAFAERMVTCPGVVSSKGIINVGCSLIVRNHRLSPAQLADCKGWDEVVRLGTQVEELNITPNGDELEHTMLAWKWLYQIYGCGFYTELIWPTSEDVAKKLDIGLPEAEVILDKAIEYHSKSQQYHKDLRQWLTVNQIDKLDTPRLVGVNMHHHQSRDVGHELYESWMERKDCDFPERELLTSARTDIYGRRKNAVRLCDFKIVQAVNWALGLQKKKDPLTGKATGGIIWVYNIEVGEWIREYLINAGITPLYFPSGKTHDANIINTKYADRIVIASQRAHGEGKELQHFHQQWFLQFARSGRLTEQTLGREHRKGQLADEVIANTNNCTEWDDLIFAATLNDTLYVHQTTKNPMRLVIADYDPVPKIFPNEVLREKVQNVKRLNPILEKMFKEKFGKDN